MSDIDPLEKAARHVAKVLAENAPEAMPDFEMLMALAEDRGGPFNPSGELRLNDIALRAYCTLVEAIIEIGQKAGLKSPPATLAFLMGVQLGHRVAHEQIGRVPRNT